MTCHLNRREFLRRFIGAGAVLVALGGLNACASTNQTSAPTSSSAPTQGASSNAGATPAAQPAPSQATEPTVAQASPTAAGVAEARPSPSPTPASLPDMAVVSGQKSTAITEAAIAAIGGIERFVGPGRKVIIKPNICRAAKPEVGATTSPEIVGKLVELCFKAGASSVQVMDLGWAGEAQYYQMSGIEDAVKAAGGRMVVMDGRTGYVKTPIPKGVDLKEYEFFSEALKTDVLINVPIAKNHSLSILTLGVKNIMGLIQNRGAIHGNFKDRLPDLLSVLMPTLTVLDATRVMVKYGPTGYRAEDLVVKNTVIASTDTVAVDAYATRFFDMKPDNVPYLVAAAERGLGTVDLSKLRVAELQV